MFDVRTLDRLELTNRALTVLWSLATVSLIAVGSSLLRGFVHGSVGGDPEYYILVGSGTMLAAAAVALIVLVQRLTDSGRR